MPSAKTEGMFVENPSQPLSFESGWDGLSHNTPSHNELSHNTKRYLSLN